MSGFSGPVSFSGVGPFHLPQGRLTLASGVPVMVAAQTAKTLVYYTPYQGNRVPIYDGVANWLSFAVSEISNDLTASVTGSAGPAAAAANSNYDLFVWNNAGVPTLTRGPLWTSDTARNLGLTLTNGVWLNTTAITNGPAALCGTYVGTIRTDGSSQANFQRGGSATAALLNVWNCYNRRQINFEVNEATASWTYSSATIRALNNSNTNRASFVRGIDEDAVQAILGARFSPAAVNASGDISIGLDSTSAASQERAAFVAGSATSISTHLKAQYTGFPGLGFHFLQALEASDGTNANTFFGAAQQRLAGAAWC